MGNMPKRFRREVADVPPALTGLSRLIVGNDAVLGRGETGDHRGVRGPGDGRDNADDAIRHDPLGYEPAQVGDVQSEAVTITEPTMVKAVNRDDEQAILLGRQQESCEE